MTTDAYKGIVRRFDESEMDEAEAPCDVARCCERFHRQYLITERYRKRDSKE